MTTSRSSKLVALSTVALLALAGCSGEDKKDSAGPASTSSTVSVPGSEAKTYTDAQLAAMLKGATVNGVALEAAPANILAEAKKGSNSGAIADAMKQATVTPEACKTASLDNAKLMPGNAPLAVSGAKSLPMVLIRSLPSAEDAKKLVEAAGSTADACKSFNMTMTQSGQKISMKGTTESLSVDSATSQTESGQKTTVTAAGQTIPMTTALGHVDNILIQVTDPGQVKLSASQLSTVLEDVAKIVEAKK
ncbi:MULTISPECIES: hypothetical protein [unclassified Luteococcus]|uniref:hypothetical protein n=1 Tax=unclassified Luteococcus TaxID=2639923 RepID=UPI00313E4574